MGTPAGLVLAALVVIRFLVLRGRFLGISHGSARLVAIVLVAVVLIGARLVMSRR